MAHQATTTQAAAQRPQPPVNMNTWNWQTDEEINIMAEWYEEQQFGMFETESTYFEKGVMQ